jgi:NADP-dependent 3-hydroxy acid dehydrogenase YdfG
VVTGASRGLGYQVAKLLAKKNIHIIGLARTVGGLEALSDEIHQENGSSTIVPIDLQDDIAIDNFALQVHERWKKIDILIHSAIIAPPMSPVTSISLKDFDKSIAVNTRATIKLIQALDPLLKHSSLKIAMFIDDPNTGKFLTSYSSAKAASRNLIRNYKEESKRIGPKVISFTPSPMPTALRARFHPGENRDDLSSCIFQAKKLISKLKL